MKTGILNVDVDFRRMDTKRRQKDFLFACANQYILYVGCLGPTCCLLHPCQRRVQAKTTGIPKFSRNKVLFAGKKRVLEH